MNSEKRFITNWRIIPLTFHVEEQGILDLFNDEIEPCEKLTHLQFSIS